MFFPGSWRRLKPLTMSPDQRTSMPSLIHRGSHASEADETASPILAALVQGPGVSASRVSSERSTLIEERHPSISMGLSLIPFKHNADRRHPIPKLRSRITNCLHSPAP